MSLDGYYEGPVQDVMALPMDEAFDAYNAERLRAADTLLLGSNTYDGFKGFWPWYENDLIKLKRTHMTIEVKLHGK